MKTDRERDALKALLDLKDKPEHIAKNSRRWSLVCFAVGIGLLSAMAIWNKHLNDAAYIILSFGAGFVLALSYSRYVEAAGVRVLQRYLKRDEIAARNELLVREAKDLDQKPG
jgi:predicted acyltransferase